MGNKNTQMTRRRPVSFAKRMAKRSNRVVYPVRLWACGLGLWRCHRVMARALFRQAAYGLLFVAPIDRRMHQRPGQGRQLHG